MTLTYCGNIVRQQDSDRYLLSLFAPAKHRHALWALFAFNCEIAKTREVVSETTIGLIRLQWWRDAIAEIYEGKPVRQHEVVQPLAQAIKNYHLPRDLFDTLIYAREFDLEDVIPSNIAGLRTYCEKTFKFKEKERISKVIKTLVVDKNSFRYDDCGQNNSHFTRKVARMTSLYEAQISSVDYDVFDPRLGTPPPFMALRLFFSDV